MVEHIYVSTFSMLEMLFTFVNQNYRLFAVEESSEHVYFQLRGLDGCGDFQTVLTSSKRRAVYKKYRVRI